MEIKDLEQNPNKFGFPTFEQFAKNPEHFKNKFLGTETQALESVSNGSSNNALRQATKETVYEILHYRTKKLEDVERIARDNGIDLRAMKYRAVINNMGGHMGQVVVKFMSQADYERRQSW